MSDPAIAHLRGDPVLARLLDRVGDDEIVLDPSRGGRYPVGDHYAALIRAIVGQQVSVHAARAIWGRLLDRFGGRPPLPEEILETEHEELRAAAGLSNAKARYLRSLAEHVVSGELELDRLADMTDEEIVAELVAVKGIGEWSAHMFLLFQLERPDVLAVGDLGIRRAAMLAYDLDDLPSPAELTELAEPWRPFRSVACRLLWKSLDNEPVTD